MCRQAVRRVTDVHPTASQKLERSAEIQAVSIVETFLLSSPDLEDRPVCLLPSSPLLFFFFDALLSKLDLNPESDCFLFFCACVPVNNRRAFSITNVGIRSIFHFNSLPLCLQGHLPVSCLEVRSANGPLPDSEHYLNVQGKVLKVRVWDGADSQKTKKFYS